MRDRLKGITSDCKTATGGERSAGVEASGLSIPAAAGGDLYAPHTEGGLDYRDYRPQDYVV
jgi:hypothetical protein